jgi:hypothetical protein
MTPRTFAIGDRVFADGQPATIRGVNADGSFAVECADSIWVERTAAELEADMTDNEQPQESA